MAVQELSTSEPHVQLVADLFGGVDQVRDHISAELLRYRQGLQDRDQDQVLPRVREMVDSEYWTNLESNPSSIRSSDLGRLTRVIRDFSTANLVSELPITEIAADHADRITRYCEESGFQIAAANGGSLTELSEVHRNRAAVIHAVLAALKGE